MELRSKASLLVMALFLQSFVITGPGIGPLPHDSLLDHGVEVGSEFLLQSWGQGSRVLF